MAVGQAIAARSGVARVDLYTWLGVVVGVLMPVLNALLYPVYMHQMQPAWAEWTRLMELPFVACELVVVHIAIRGGYHDGAIWARLPRDVKVAFGLLLLGLFASSIFASKNPSASVTLSLTTLIHIRFLAAVYFMAARERASGVGPLFRYLLIGIGALTVLTAWKFLLPPPEESVPGGRIEWASALPGFISVRHFGSWIGAVAAGPMIALLYARRHDDHVTGLAYLLTATLTCWSGTRGAVLALVVVVVIAVASLRRLPERQALMRVGALSLLALGLSVLFAPGLPEFALFIKEDIVSADAMAAGRLELWHDTIFRWLDAPLFGWGSGSVFWEVNIGWSHTQPHNVVLQFLISWGLVGAAGGLWLLGRAIGATHAIGMRDEQLRPLAAMTYSLLFMSLLEGMLYYPRFIMMIAIGFAVLFAAKERAG